MSTTPTNPAQDRRFPERRPDTPRRVRHGVKLRAKEPAAVAATPLTQRWMATIESAIARDTMQAGFEYARAGQTISLAFEAGAIEALVQGTAAKPYATRLLLPVVTDEQWPGLIEAMAHEAMYVAKLLAGELPPGIDELFAARGAALLPAELRTECTCAAHTACKHAACVAHLAAEKLAGEPLAIFALLGMPAERIIERLRQARTIQARGTASAHADAQIPETQVAAAPLEACLEEFWRSGPRLLELERRPRAQHVPHALLRRLGPSPLNGRFPMAGLLASIYDTVTAAATTLRDESDQPQQDERA